MNILVRGGALGALFCMLAACGGSDPSDSSAATGGMSPNVESKAGAPATVPAATASSSSSGAATAGSTGTTTAGSTAVTPSNNGSVISATAKASATKLVDSAHNVWTVSSGVVNENSTAAGVSYNVIALLYYGGKIYQENSSCQWFAWAGTTWSASTNPDPSATPACPSASASTPNSTLLLPRPPRIPAPSVSARVATACAARRMARRLF